MACLEAYWCIDRQWYPVPMTSRRANLKDDTYFWAMKLLQENPSMTQRELARAMGISLGGANYCLQALIEKGWLKMQNFSKSADKMSYAYLLTPVGMVEKAALTARFLQRKMQEYEDLKLEIEALKRDVAQHDTTFEP